MDILVIDDEPIIHESLKRVLGREGFRVDGALCGREGLKLLSQKKFDLILTDLMMPEMDGLEFLAELRKAGIHTPMIMITGYPTIRTALQALRLGAADYIPKPVTRKELLPPVWRTLRRAREAAASSGEHPRAEGAPAEPEGNNAAGPPAPGDRFSLPEHSWALYEQEGTLGVGVEESFLRSVGRVVQVRLPEENDLVEQGFPGIALVNEDGEEHHPFLPISGRVVERSRHALEHPSEIHSGTCLIRVIPSHFAAELPFLRRTRRDG
jgi:CheY-like chemotaxis protein